MMLHFLIAGCLCFLGSVPAINAGDASQVPVPKIADGSGASRTPFRVAIIGGGAAGSSAAYHLHHFASSSRVPLNITLFDDNARIGGRATTVDALGDPRFPTEVGASIFVKVNRILDTFSRDFGLQTSTKLYDAAPEAQLSLGIWNGRRFVFAQGEDGGWRGWLNLAKLLLKYGMSPIWTHMAMKDAVGRFLRFYDPPFFPFSSLQRAVEDAGLLEFTSRTGEEVLTKAGISEEFSRELVQASTRVNYGQNLNGIHGLETLVCMAIDGPMSIEGGNWQMFNEAVERSGASVHLNTTVTGVSKASDGTYRVQAMSQPEPPALNPVQKTLHRVRSALGQPLPAASSNFSQEFDAVILAAPYQYANISFDPPLPHVPRRIDYVTLHVTLLTTPHLLSSRFFNLSSPSDVPASVLTTLPAGLALPPSNDASDLTGPPGVWSISTLRVIQPDPSVGVRETQYLYKIFSPRKLTGTFVSRVFGFEHAGLTNEDPLSDVAKDEITWVHEKKWHSYPYLPPVAEFEPLQLDAVSSKQEQCPVGPLEVRHTCVGDTSPSMPQETARGVWYTSGIEPFISTMETSALMGRNVARLIVDRLSHSMA